jgi:hypothetical protein
MQILHLQVSCLKLPEKRLGLTILVAQLHVIMKYYCSTLIDIVNKLGLVSVWFSVRPS